MHSFKWMGRVSFVIFNQIFIFNQMFLCWFEISVLFVYFSLFAKRVTVALIWFRWIHFIFQVFQSNRVLTVRLILSWNLVMSIWLDCPIPVSQNSGIHRQKQNDFKNRKKLTWKLNDNRYSFGIYSGFQANPAGKYNLNVKGPALYLVGPYKISGRVLVLPIQGEGKSNITLRNAFNRLFY